MFHSIIHEYLYILDSQAMPKVQELSKHWSHDALIGFAPSSQPQIPWISVVYTWLGEERSFHPI